MKKRLLIALSIVIAIAIIGTVVIFSTINPKDKTETTKNSNDVTSGLSTEETTTSKSTAESTTRNKETTTKNNTNTTQTTTQNTTTSNSNNNAGSSQSFADQVISLVNQERAKVGLSSLSSNQSLTNAALVRAREIESSFSHTRPDGSAFNTVLAQNGVSYSGAGENIAYGQQSPEQVMQGWMNSEGHRANILNSSFTSIGVGHYKNAAGVNYWVQLFTY